MERATIDIVIMQVYNAHIFNRVAFKARDELVKIFQFKRYNSVLKSLLRGRFRHNSPFPGEPGLDDHLPPPFPEQHLWRQVAGVFPDRVPLLATK